LVITPCDTIADICRPSGSLVCSLNASPVYFGLSLDSTSAWSTCAWVASPRL
jgi:hypothetical protein